MPASCSQLVQSYGLQTEAANWWPLDRVQSPLASLPALKKLEMSPQNPGLGFPHPHGGACCLVHHRHLHCLPGGWITCLVCVSWPAPTGTGVFSGCSGLSVFFSDLLWVKTCQSWQVCSDSCYSGSPCCPTSESHDFRSSLCHLGSSPPTHRRHLEVGRALAARTWPGVVLFTLTGSGWHSCPIACEFPS